MGCNSILLVPESEGCGCSGTGIGKNCGVTGPGPNGIKSGNTGLSLIITGIFGLWMPGKGIATGIMGFDGTVAGINCGGGAGENGTIVGPGNGKTGPWNAGTTGLGATGTGNAAGGM